MILLKNSQGAIVYKLWESFQTHTSPRVFPHPSTFQAHEKAVEIKIKTEHDFNLEKQLLVHNAKVKIQDEYVQKEKDWKVQDRIKHSGMIGESRVRKMKARDDFLNQLRDKTLQELGEISSTPDYINILRDLIVQSLIKIEEDTVEVSAAAYPLMMTVVIRCTTHQDIYIPKVLTLHLKWQIQILCRKCDVEKVKGVLSKAVKTYTEFMKKETGIVKSVQVRWDSKSFTIATTRWILNLTLTTTVSCLGYGE